MEQKKKILIIDDETILLEAIAKKLGMEGFEVITAVDGEEGLEKIRRELPDLVLLDILMPKMNGMDVLEEINKDPELSKIPFIIISNSGQPVEIERAMSLGVKDYLIKADFDPDEVLAKVNNVLLGEKRAGSGSVEESDSGNASRKIMLIEDDQLLRDLCQRKISSEGFSVETAIDPKEGLEKIAKYRPDLILLDLVLPGMSGFDVLKELKSNPDPGISGIPVIILSNLGQESDMQKGKDLGAADYLIKATITTDEIVGKIKNILGV